MLIEVPEKVAKKIVVKRDGKKVEFDGAKIALAIQKGFGDIVGNEDPKTAKYNETDVNKVYSKVLSRIEKIDSDKIKIEEIQDLIELRLSGCLWSFCKLSWKKGTVKTIIFWWKKAT